jgi:hypothetical protein
MHPKVKDEIIELIWKKNTILVDKQLIDELEINKLSS